MSTAAERRAENAYETRADKTGGEIPSGDVHDNSYAIQGGSRAGPGAADDEYVVPVKTDEEALADDPDPVGKMSGQEANSDAMLEKDDKEAINPDNILKNEPRTRHGGKKTVDYREPGDEEGLPGPEDGSSYLRTGKTEIVS